MNYKHIPGIVSFNTCTFSVVGGGISLIGGNRLIFLPCLPVLRCHQPDRGRLPNSRLRWADPTCSLL